MKLINAKLFSARRVHHVEARERFGDPAERGRLRERVHGAQDRVLDQVHRPLLSGNALTGPLLAFNLCQNVG